MKVGTCNQTVMQTKKVNYGPPKNLGLGTFKVNTGAV